MDPLTAALIGQLTIADEVDTSNLARITYEEMEDVIPTLDRQLQPPPGTPLAFNRVSEDCSQNIGPFAFEIWQKILPHLDLETLYNFRLASRGAVQTVDSLTEYQELIKHAPNILRATYYLNTNNLVTLEALHKKLFTVDCECCGKFGGYLYLITFERVCLICILIQRRYQPRDRATIKQQFELKDFIIDTLPHIQHQKLGELIDVTHAYNTAMTTLDSFVRFILRNTDHPHNPLIASILKIQLPNTKENIFQARLRLADLYERYNPATKDHWAPPTIDGKVIVPVANRYNPQKLAAVVKIPSISADNVVEWGFYCLGCKEYAGMMFENATQYNFEKFLEHLRETPEVGNGIRHPMLIDAGWNGREEILDGLWGRST